MGEIVGAPLTLDPVAQAVAAARQYVRAALEQLGTPSLAESAELGVSELVTNAVLHGRTPFTITVRRTDAGGIRIEVSDHSRLPPQQRRISTFATTGRGLRLVASVASSWGVDPLPGEGPGKVVWFEPQEHATAAGFEESDWVADVEALMR